MNALSDCLKEEAAAILSAEKRLDSKEVENCLRLLDQSFLNKSKLILSGVGKSGIVARKIAATFSSIGLIAIYLNPLDALHGDIGIVGNQDVTILLSNSGETDEIIEIIPHLKKRGSSLIALVGNINSTIAKQCDQVLDASVNKEVCPLNLAPTASTAVAMSIGDALAAVWMQRQGISQQDFAYNHPAGSLGKKLTLSAIDLMIPIEEVRGIDEDSPLEEVINSLTSDGLGAAWIKDPKNNQRIKGLITDGDLRRALKLYSPEKWTNLSAKNIMSTNLISITAKELAINAMRLMEENEQGKVISLLPIIDDKKNLIGLLRLHDLVNAGFMK